MARVRIFRSALAVVLLAAAGCLAQAQTAASYPSRAITMIVPFPPGGPTDAYARMVAAKMQERWGQPVVVENKPGGTGVLGNNLVIKSPPNGYTLLFTSNSAHLISVLLKNPKPYDSIKDFTPISIAIKYPMYLLINPNLPVKTVPEFIAYAKANSGKLNYSSVGQGSGGHLACELFNIAAGTNITHVPYKGASSAQASTIAGDTQMFCDSVGNSQPMVEAGKLRGLATFSDKRVSIAENVPTLGEVGFPGLDAFIWLGLLGPPGMPADIASKLNSEMVRIMNLPDVRERALKGGNEIVANSQEQFIKDMTHEIEFWSRVIKLKNIKED
ncbi:MAG: tripartite tricarboxylate transporter substrate binding protein [Oxalobacteraceae bacterium]|jgi:tripartite-type tricarboxylate transporter receptor subunit TctC|nr:tripartite tricarboxylate transporter substrate binding protein [Oxalobacteraceae bacterium]